MPKCHLDVLRRSDHPHRDLAASAFPEISTVLLALRVLPPPLPRGEVDRGTVEVRRRRSTVSL